MRHAMSLASLVLVLAVSTVLANDKPTPAARLKAIQKEVVNAEAAFGEVWAKLPDLQGDDPKVVKLVKEFRANQQARFEEALKIAKADPKSATGFDALEWMLTTPKAYYLPPFKTALELLTEHHATNPKIGKGIALLAYYPPHDRETTYPQVIALFNTVAEKNPDRIVRGQAALGLAWLARDEFRMAESRSRPDVDRLAQKAEKAFEAVLRNYGDCRNLRSMGARPATATLAEEVERELYELRYLRIGKKAPDIKGEDLSGVAFQLSDHRGKVVLLVFWASWCGPCMASVPHERDLVEHFRGRPFVLVGVNGDQKKEDATKAVEKLRIPWRSFWNGKDGPGGPIAVAWNVRGWPTVYVIDPNGVIRQKYLRGKRLDEPLEKLVVEAEAAAKANVRP